MVSGWGQPQRQSGWLHSGVVAAQEGGSRGDTPAHKVLLANQADGAESRLLCRGGGRTRTVREGLLVCVHEHRLRSIAVKQFTFLPGLDMLASHKSQL